MSPVTALGTTDHAETWAFSILKNVLAPNSPHGWASIFGSTIHNKLPYPTTIPIRDTSIKLSKPTAATIALLESVRQSDAHSYFHSTNHGAHTYNFASYLKLNESETNELYYASLLHDIGKVFCSELVALPRKLTPEEQSIVQNHTIISFVVLSACGFKNLIAYSGLFHHLSFNRLNGYPKIDTELTDRICEAAHHLHLPIPHASLLDFTNIDEKTWSLMSAISLMDSLDASVDPHRKYKKPVHFSNILEDFENSQWSWKTMFNPEHKQAFIEYVDWLAPFVT